MSVLTSSKHNNHCVHYKEKMTAAGQNVKRLIKHNLRMLFSFLKTTFSILIQSPNTHFFNRLIPFMCIILFVLLPPPISERREVDAMTAPGMGTGFAGAVRRKERLDCEKRAGQTNAAPAAGDRSDQCNMMGLFPGRQ